MLPMLTCWCCWRRRSPRRPGSAARSSASPRCPRVRRIPRASAWTARATSTSSPWRRTNRRRVAGTLIVFDPNGKHLRTVTIAGSSPWLLDLRFHPQTGQLLVIDYKAAKVLSVDPKTGASSVFMTVTGKNPGLDGLTFDAAGNVYVTDAHEGIIWKVGPRRRRGVGLGQEPAAQADEARRPPSARTAWRSTTSRRRCSSPTRRTTRS